MTKTVDASPAGKRFSVFQVGLPGSRHICVVTPWGTLQSTISWVRIKK